MTNHPVTPTSIPPKLLHSSSILRACSICTLLVGTVGLFMVAVKRQKKKKRRFRPWLGLISWWKRRKFYFVQDDTVDEESMLSERKPIRQETAHTPLLNLPKATYFNQGLTRAPQQPMCPRTRNFTVDSFQDSVESMDSLVESYWDPEDDTSQATAVASNTGQGDHQTDFLLEHLNFLSVQTQPREVELVYNT
jgi:hypothetical protein